MNRKAGPDPGWSHHTPGGYVAPSDRQRILIERFAEAIDAPSPPPQEVHWTRWPVPPEIEGHRLAVQNAVAEATSKFYAQLEERAAQLPDPPEGWHWVLIHEPPELGRGDMASNTMSFVTEARFELREVDPDE